MEMATFSRIPIPESVALLGRVGVLQRARMLVLAAMRGLPALLEYARTEESLLCPRKHECQSDAYVGRTGVVSRTATARAGTNAIETHIG